jgi:16S rRNA (adenine1518-N6/adenine1519-N6)-dimethyltransferase
MDLKELKILWTERGFRPGKSLGQNFLIDKNVRDKIIDRLDLEGDETIIEIGPGFGAMTFELASKCKKLIAIDKDSRICGVMRPLFEEKNIDLIEGDILDQDLCALAHGKKLIVYGNIPYNITTPIIEKIIEYRRCIKRAYLVAQDEYVTRITSGPGSKIYGSISCFVQFYTRPEKIFKIKKNSFYPVPKVDSALLSMEVLDEPSVKVKDEDLMFKIIRKAFSQRRKKIINPLSKTSFLEKDREAWEKIFTQCKISSSNRAEDLSLEDYAKIANFS